MKKHLQPGLILTHPAVIGELAFGNLQQRRVLLITLQDLPQASTTIDPEAIRFIENHQLYGLGIGYVDPHLLAAVWLTPGASQWTRDKRWREVASRLGIAGNPPYRPVRAAEHGGNCAPRGITTSGRSFPPTTCARSASPPPGDLPASPSSVGVTSRTRCRHARTARNIHQRRQRGSLPAPSRHGRAARGKVISRSVDTERAGQIRMSHLGRAGFVPALIRQVPWRPCRERSFSYTPCGSTQRLHEGISRLCSWPDAESLQNELENTRRLLESSRVIRPKARRQ